MSQVVPSQRNYGRGRDAAVRATIVSASSRLQGLWQEAATQRSTSPPVSLERRRWDNAAERLLDAMVALESYVATIDPMLGRRDWRSRCDGVTSDR
jgi:hypothetical protein